MKYQLNTLGLLRHSLQVPPLLSLEFVYPRIVCLRLFLRGSLFFFRGSPQRESFNLFKNAFTNKINCNFHDLETNLNHVGLFFSKKFM